MAEARIEAPALHGLHPADIADLLQRLDPAEAERIFRQIPVPVAAKVLDELDREKAQDLIETLSNAGLARLLHELPAEAAADLAGELEQEQRGQVLAALPPEEAQPIRELLRYPPDTAGGIMSNRFLTVRPEFTVQEALEFLRRHADRRSDDVLYLYATDASGHLMGVVPFRDLIFSRPDARVSDVMKHEVKFLRVTADQEEIARQFEHYHYLGLPVVDGASLLLGVVKVSDVLQVAQQEATEDMQLMVGLSGEERALSPWRRSVRKRLPWLYVNLLTAFMAAGVVGIFEETIAQWTALALFLPIIAGQGGNAGMQTLTVIIRDLALGELAPGDGRKALLKEAMVGLVNGIAIGAVVGLAGYLWKGSAALGWVAGTAMLLNQLAAALSGVLIPFGLKFVRIDPALASSIFVTTVTDVAGFFFFLWLATLAMRLF